MLYKKIFFALPLCLLLLPATRSLAQQGASGKPAAFKLFFEKAYLHIDRDCYASGDNIWFKAYLVNAQSNIPTNSSDNLYVELIAPDAGIVSREVIRLDHGMGVGDFKLDDSIPGGNYKLRAYTNWMRNFGNHFIFEKDLTIKSVISVKTAAGTSNAAGTGGAAGTGTGNAAATGRSPGTGGSGRKTGSAGPPAAPTYDIQFLPEGGNLIEGLNSVVSFRASDGNGKGVAVSGSLLNSKGDTLLHFQSSYMGMGSFTFTPAAGLAYRALLHYPGGPVISMNLPAANPDGYTMSILEKDTALAIHIQANAARLAGHPNAELNLAGRHAGRLVYGEKIRLQDGQALIMVPKSDFPQGIACMTLYDEALRPHCERLVYIEKDDSVRLTVFTDKTSYLPREKVTIHIQAADAQNQPVKTELSLAVVDRGIISADPGNIRSYLELGSELKGEVENAAAYFDPANKRRGEQLDLLLRTQGWRSFLWRSLADTAIRISYLPEPGITISGKVRETFANKPLSKMNITLYAAGAKGNKFYATQTDSAGRYFVDGLELYGAQDIRINSKNDKGRKGGRLSMDTLFSHPVALNQAPFSLPGSSVVPPGYAVEAVNRWNMTERQPLHAVLPTATVISNSKPVILRDGSVYRSFVYPEYDFTIGPKDLAFETLADFLLHNVPEALANGDDDGIHFLAGGKTISPRFMVDKKENIFGLDYFAVHMDQVIKVSVQHLVGPPSFSRGQASASGRMDLGESIRDAFIIFLTLKPGAYNTDLAVISTEIRGYYEARNFYAPSHAVPNEDSQPDVRTTLFWEPYLVTDADGKATVSFYNADPVTTIGIDVQGLTEKGIPVAAVGKYKVAAQK